MARKLSSLTPDQRLDLQARSANGKRTPELRNAWEHSEIIKALYKTGKEVIDIADQFGVTKWNIYRILKKG